MATIKVSITVPLTIPPQTLFAEILNMPNWESFQGFGPLPGIKQAKFLQQSSKIIGSRIEVLNLDGSRHTETIIQWQPHDYIEMNLAEFSPPLSRLASHFTERWQVSKNEVTRSMTMHGKSVLTLPLLWLIGRFMKRALNKHTKEICSL